jgi:2-oxoglutarate dehydrogenase E2 component (dihydrolipoamide succinyltransferase)
MTEVRLPKTGDAVEEGTLVQWLVENGARVERGDPLYLLETDKVEMEIEAPCAGVVSHVGTAGEIYRVGELIATIAEDRG